MEDSMIAEMERAAKEEQEMDPSKIARIAVREYLDRRKKRKEAAERAAAKKKK